MMAASAGSAIAANAASSHNLCAKTATELAKLLRAKKVSAREVVEAHLRQIERLNPKVNAIVTLVADRALARAKQLDEEAARGKFAGVLHGLPIAHKDLKETKGIRTTFGSPIFRDYVPNFNTLAVERELAAGAITIGKSNTPEFGAGSQTFNPVFGATKSPYDLTKTCGGSSGGAAVALACGMVPIADGSDTGGSLRNPAAFCSVVGFRTTPGRVPRYPAGAGWNTLSVDGPMGRSVQDVALFLSALAGPDARAPLSIHESGARFAQPLGREFKGVRVAWCPNFGGIPVDRRVLDAMNARRSAFTSIGCTVEDASPPDFTDADEVFKVFRALGFYQQHAAKLDQHRSVIKETVIQEIEAGAKLTGPMIAAAEVKRSRLYAKFAEFLDKYEYVVLPTTQVPPFDVNQPYITEIEGQKMSSYIDWMKSCYYITVITHPAISVPAGYTSEGSPVGLQIVGRQQADFAVLQIAHAYEQATHKDWRSPAIAEL